MSNLFTEEKYNALRQALQACVEDENEWLEFIPKESLFKLFVDKLEELGYIIVKK